MSSSSGPTIDELLSQGERLRPPRGSAPEVWRCLWRGEVLLLKTYHHTSTIYRQTVGRLALDREWWALKALAGTGRAPLPRFRPLPWAVAMEFVEGTPLEELPRGRFACTTLVAEAQALLWELHRAGVVHGDIGHDCWSVQGRESNVMVTGEGRLVAIDFAGSWSLTGGNWPWQRLGRALQRHDELLVTKILYHLGDAAVRDHAGWRLPSQRPVAWWDLMRLLGKL